MENITEDSQKESLVSKPKVQYTPRITPSSKPKNLEKELPSSSRSLFLICGVLIIVGVCASGIYSMYKFESNMKFLTISLFVFPVCTSIMLILVGLGKLHKMVQEMKVGVPIGGGFFTLIAGSGIAFELIRQGMDDIATNSLAGMICWLPSVILCVYLVRLGYSEAKGKLTKEGVLWIILTIGSLMYVFLEALL